MILTWLHTWRHQGHDHDADAAALPGRRPGPVAFALVAMEMRRTTVGLFGFDKTAMVTPEEALRGHSDPMPVPARHEVLVGPLRSPYPAATEVAESALCCFWGAEKMFWQRPRVVT